MRSMLTSQMIKSGRRRRAASAPSTPSPASTVSKPFLCNAQAVASRNIASSSMTRIFCMSGRKKFWRVKHGVHGREKFFGREGLEDECGVGEFVGKCLILAQTAGGDDAHVWVEPAQRSDCGGAVQVGHHHVRYHQVDV